MWLQYLTHWLGIQLKEVQYRGNIGKSNIRRLLLETHNITAKRECVQNCTSVP